MGGRRHPRQLSTTTAGQGAHVLGLARSHRGLGPRVAVPATNTKTRTWQLDKAPRAWNQATMEALLGNQEAYKDIQITKKQIRGQTTTWWFTATTRTDLDVHPIFATLDEQTHELWAFLAAPSRRHTHTHTSSRHIHDTSTTKWQVPNHHSTHSTHSTTTGHGTVTKEAAPAEGEKASDQATKRQCVEHRQIPEGFTKQDLPKDGACMFHGLAKGLTTDSKPILGLQTRGETLAHMLKHAKTYQDLWDGLYANGNKAPTFEAYINDMQRPDAWGGYLELTAAARHYNTRIYIVPEKATDDIMVFHDSSKATTTIALWYTGTHYDYLQPHNGIPDTILQQRGKPKQGLRGGGGSTRTQHTVWTSKATTTQQQQHTVFTSKQPTATPAASDNEDLDVDDFLPPPPPPQHTPDTTPWQHAMRKRTLRTTRGPNNSSFHANGSITWKCPLCPFTTSHGHRQHPPASSATTCSQSHTNSKANTSKHAIQRPESRNDYPESAKPHGSLQWLPTSPPRLQDGTATSAQQECHSKQPTTTTLREPGTHYGHMHRPSTTKQIAKNGDAGA